MVSSYARAALAAAAAGALLTTSTAGYAEWQQAVASDAEKEGPVQAGPVSVEVLAADGTPRAVDPGAQGGSVRAVVGESVRVHLPVTVRTQGSGGVLRVEVPAATGDAPLAAELTTSRPRLEITPQDGGAALPIAAEGTSAEVPASADGHTYLLRWTTSTRATRDGRPPGRRNAWGSGAGSLQGASVGARPLSVTLTPRAGAPGHVQAVVPAVEMDTTAVRLTADAPGPGSGGANDAGGTGGTAGKAGAGVTTLEGLGTMALALRPTSIALAPLAPTTATELRDMRRLGLATEVTWGSSGCGTPRWVVGSGGFATRAAASPTPVRGAAATEPLPAGEQRRACVRLAGAPEDLVRRYAGRPVQARTTWTSTSPAPATWSSTATNEARLALPFPSPSAATCRVTGGRVALRWSWPSTSSTPPARVADTSAIARWVLLARTGSGTWTQVAEIRDGDGREHRLPVAALGKAGLGRSGSAQVMVRAVPSMRGGAAVDATRTWTVGVRDGRPTCGAAWTPAAADTASPAPSATTSPAPSATTRAATTPSASTPSAPAAAGRERGGTP